jgi:hypothetical protein
LILASKFNIIMDDTEVKTDEEKVEGVEGGETPTPATGEDEVAS